MELTVYLDVDQLAYNDWSLNDYFGFKVTELRVLYSAVSLS